VSLAGGIRPTAALFIIPPTFHPVK